MYENNVGKGEKLVYHPFEKIEGKMKIFRRQNSILAMFHSLPNDKFSDGSKLKALADNKINVTEKLKFVLRKVENTVGKRENAC